MAGLLPAMLGSTAIAQSSTNTPIFQFGAFYNLDLDFSPGQMMVMNGKVHVNGTFWMYPQASVTFNDTVEATVVVTNKDDPNDQQNLTSYTTPVYNFTANGGKPLSGVGRLNMLINTTNVEAILNLPPAGLGVPNGAGYMLSNQMYLYNECDLIISNSVSGTNGNSFWGTNFSVYFDDSYAQTLTLLTNDLQWTNGSVYYVTNGSGMVKTITTNPVVLKFYSFLTNVTFYDFREGKTVQAVQIDVAKFNIWLTNTATRVSGGVTNYVAGNYWNNLSWTDNNSGLNTIYVYNSVPLSSTTLPAVRLVNGYQLPFSTNGTYPTRGLTVATPMPLYVLGNYNIQTNSGGSQSAQTTNTAWTWPAALMGDSITVLSSDWSDSYNSGTALSSRSTANTTINAACLAGVVPSTYTTHKQYSGGLENFLRLEESWSSTLCYNGSIVVMFPSIYATNFWTGPSQISGYPAPYYAVPTRKWGFDANFMQQSKLPPLTPLIVNTNLPVIVTQPQNQTVTSGSNATFNVSATGFGTLGYQWSFNGTYITGATNTSLTLTNVQLNQAGFYAVLVTNVFGSILSSSAVLTITVTSPSIQAQPTNQTAFVNGTATFTVVAGGTTPLSYQWFFNGTNNYFLGATNTSLTLTNVQLYEAGNYAVLVTNAFGAILSSNAVLTVVALPPTIQAQPTNQTVFVNGTATFTVVAGGTAPLSYQWNFDGTNLVGATNALLTLTNVQASQAGNYAVLVTNLYGSILSSNATLTVNPLPPCDPAPSGLVSWWPAEGDANDILGNNNGTLVGGASFAAGKVGQAFSFDNSGTQSVDISRSSSLNLTNQVTIEFWMKADPGNSMQSYQGFVTSDYYGISITSGNPNLGVFGIDFFINDNGTYYEIANANGGGAKVSAGVWHHIAGTYDGTKCQLYVDGQPWGNPYLHTGAISPMPTNGFVSIGSEDGRVTCGCTDRHFWGLIDEASIYNRALSSNEIAAIYSTEGSGKCPPPPTILVQPTNQLVAVGDTATFTVQTVGTPPLSYQWNFNGTDIDGATNASLTLANVQTNQAGNYAVLVFNAYGSILSSNAVLTVNPPPPPCDPAPSGLADWWPGEGNANDIVGNNNGTLVGGATFAAGEVGQAFSFDGSSGYVSIPDSPSMDSFTSSITIETWIKVNQLTLNTDWMGIVTKGNNSWRLQATMYTNTVYFGLDGVSPSRDLYGTRNVNDGQWHHVAAVYDGTNMFLYVDGTLDVSQPATGLIAQNNSPVCLGATYNAYELSCHCLELGYFFNGLVDEASIYNRALTASEIAAIYAAGSGGKCFTPTPPAIIAQPTNQTVVVGGTATFTVQAAGTPPLNYQWSFDGTNILGATNMTLTLNNVQLSQAGNYAVTVTNLYGSVLSSNVVLTVLVPPSITTQPSGCTNVVGATAGFSVVADGTEPLSYQWQFNNTNLDGATNATLILNNVTMDQAGAYSVTITNIAGGVISSNAVLSVYATAAATLNAFSFSGDNGFQFQVAGVPGFNYAVQESTNLIDWVSLFTNTSPFSFTDTNTVSLPQQFYRAIYMP